ncbi:MAG: hypothetical protein SGI72_04125 [Planctomycetota bacterium]|nr:hypothetical protein [Planctomycetota bacterium]
MSTSVSVSQWNVALSSAWKSVNLPCQTAMPNHPRFAKATDPFRRQFRVALQQIDDASAQRIEFADASR